jgi:hypothetical protein
MVSYLPAVTNQLDTDSGIEKGAEGGRERRGPGDGWQEEEGDCSTAARAKRYASSCPDLDV